MRLHEIIKLVEIFGESLNTAVEEHYEEIEGYLYDRVDDICSLLGVSHLRCGGLVFVYCDFAGETQIYEIDHYSLVTHKLAAGQELTKDDIDYLYHSMPFISRDGDTIYIQAAGRYYKLTSDSSKPVEVELVKEWREVNEEKI